MSLKETRKVPPLKDKDLNGLDRPFFIEKDADDELPQPGEFADGDKTVNLKDLIGSRGLGSLDLQDLPSLTEATREQFVNMAKSLNFDQQDPGRKLDFSNADLNLLHDMLAIINDALDKVIVDDKYLSNKDVARISNFRQVIRDELAKRRQAK